MVNKEQSYAKEFKDCPFVIPNLATDNEPIIVQATLEVVDQNHPINIPAFILEYRSAILSRPSQAYQRYIINKIIMDITPTIKGNMWMRLWLS
jgi:hypothetical protein